MLTEKLLKVLFLSKVTPDGKSGAMIVLTVKLILLQKMLILLVLQIKFLISHLQKILLILKHLKALPIDGGKVGEKVVEYVGVIGEKLELSYYDKD